MLMAYGFLRKVFQIFEDFETPIDMISTSIILKLTVGRAATRKPVISIATAVRPKQRFCAPERNL
jgi:aspartate kinase